MEETQSSTIERVLVKLAAHKKEGLWGVFLFCLLICAFIVFASSGFSYRDHLELKNTIVRWQQRPIDMVLFEKISQVLKKNPKLLRQYDASIAQTLIGMARYDQAVSYTEHPIAYLRSESPEHASFSEITLLIEKGLYQEALERSIRLKEQMGREESYLYFHNLLRIASLQKQLGNLPGEMAAWEDCKEFLGWKEGLTASCFSEEIIRLYKEKNVDLKGYVENRAQECSSAMKSSF
ncbi:MAG TPA: hypothetical protein DCE71_07480 [Parachlamydiales bacterium]|nr:hypothetical protein [Parachlamydiales bacterium]